MSNFIICANTRETREHTAQLLGESTLFAGLSDTRFYLLQ